MREGELFGLAEEDLDLDGDKTVRVRRQVKKLRQRACGLTMERFGCLTHRTFPSNI